MEPVSSIQTFMKMQTALNKIVRDGLLLGRIETEGHFDSKRYKSGTYGQKERLLADAVKELYESYSEKNVFTCGGSVKLPEHDQKSLIVKLLDGDPQACMPPDLASTMIGQSGEFDHWLDRRIWPC